MTLKLTGAEFNAFMADKEFWFEGRWYQDGALSINGGEFFDWDAEPIESDDKLRWQGGELYDNAEPRTPWFDMEGKMRAWLKARSVTIVVLEIENWDLEPTMERILKNASVKVVK